MVSCLLGQGQCLFYFMVLVGKEEYLSWIVTRETCIQRVNHVTLEITYGQRKKIKSRK